MSVLLLPAGALALRSLLLHTATDAAIRYGTQYRDHVQEKINRMRVNVPNGVAAAASKGLTLYAQGYGGRGLRPETIEWAKRFEKKQPVPVARLRTMRAWHARHASDRRPDWERLRTPGYVAYLLWGGAPGRTWSETIVERVEQVIKKPRP